MILPKFTLYASAMFRLHMPNNFGVTALQSSNTRKIDLYSKHYEVKLQAHIKTLVTFDWNDVQTWNLYHCVCYELRNGLFGKLFLLQPFFYCKLRWNLWRKIDCVNVTWTNSHNSSFHWLSATWQRFLNSFWVGKYST